MSDTAAERRLLRTQWAMVVVTGLPGIAAVIALIFTFSTVQQSGETLQIAEQGQITDRYNDAVTNLGSDTIDIRLGGIYALQRIMTDSARDQPAIIRILCAFARVHAPQKPHSRSAPPSLKAIGAMPPDIAAALQVLVQRNTAEDGSAQIDLHGANLANADLKKADLDHANLRGANLDFAMLEGASLANVDLYGANVRFAGLNEANLTKADLELATLDGADLTGVDLTGANLVLADFSQGDLSEATLTVDQLLSASRIPPLRQLPKPLASDSRVRAKITRDTQRDAKRD
ncbi:pentapeptide repeat-containing protein [Streptomyces sp. NBC_01571]|uniref:pentapeptide repeat-containing protein n=1 Tax=Streptomyces sp. NBC_01571 TaxID=2975883 RepID=UPI002251C58B|nr:pentapeptide repeat-containing protein [Streptomyces sp. NBC_01571]MCX4581010.1 pentapeptide repeat-containing protein [Streptomyces sp. NBC_01571]